MTTKKVFEFTTKVRRFYYYQKIWQQKKRRGSFVFMNQAMHFMFMVSRQ